MKILISGKHMEVGDSLREHVEQKLEECVNKYLGRVVGLTVVFAKESHRFKVDINGNTGTSSGVIIKSSDFGDDVYATFDNAAHKIEKQLRRYKNRLTDHHKKSHHVEGEFVPTVSATKYVIEDHKEDHHDESPIIIAEKATAIERLTVSEAVMKMDLAELPALMFFNSLNGRINVVYRRVDGNISWVDPEQAKAA